MSTVRGCDPGDLLPAARVSELAALLARGYRRLLAQNQQNGLADNPEAERACDPAALSRRANHKEKA